MIKRWSNVVGLAISINGAACFRSKRGKRHRSMGGTSRRKI